MAKQSRPQKQTVARVMHEFKHGELRIGAHGPRVKNAKQAIAVALHEAGATREESGPGNKAALRNTKGKERRGETAQADREGRPAQDRTLKGATARKRRGADGASREQLYAEAQRRDIKGRSRMSKAELAQALHH
jgi:hypothetical protein